MPITEMFWITRNVNKPIIYPDLAMRLDMMEMCVPSHNYGFRILVYSVTWGLAVYAIVPFFKYFDYKANNNHHDIKIIPPYMIFKWIL